MGFARVAALHDSRRISRMLVGSLLFLAVLPATGCEKIKELVAPPLAAPQLTLAASRSSVPTGGADVEISGTVTQGGAPVAGTTVQFSATAGEFIGNASAATDDSGVARVTLRVTVPTSVSASLVAQGVSLSTSEQLPITVDGVTPGSIRFSLEQSHDPVEVGTPVTFTIEALNSDGSGASGNLLVGFGDGGQERVRDFRRRAKVEHTYRESSRFNVVVSLEQPDSSSSEQAFGIKVVAADELQVTVTGPEEVRIREPGKFTIALTASSARKASAEVSVDWGDGRTHKIGDVVGKTTVEHTYRDTGSYQVKVEAIDSAGRVKRDTARVRVAERIDVSISLDAGQPVAGEKELLTLSVTRSDRSVARGEAVVSFGDGSSARVTVAQGRGEVEHRWSDVSTYTVQVDYTDNSGATAAKNFSVKVEEEEDTYTGGGDDIDLRTVKFVHFNQGWIDATNIPSWKVTSQLSSVSVSPGQICMPHSKAGQWSVFPEPGSGVRVEGNPYIIANINGQWYGAFFEWMEVNGRCKSMSSNPPASTTATQMPNHIHVAPFNTWVPKKGETVYIMVTSLAWPGLDVDHERTRAVKVIWPY